MLKKIVNQEATPNAEELEQIAVACPLIVCPAIAYVAKRCRAVVRFAQVFRVASHRGPTTRWNGRRAGPDVQGPCSTAARRRSARVSLGAVAPPSVPLSKGERNEQEN